MEPRQLQQPRSRLIQVASVHEANYSAIKKMLFSKVKSSGEVISKLEAILGQEGLSQEGDEIAYKKREILREMSACLVFKRMAMHRLNNRDESYQRKSSHNKDTWLTWIKFRLIKVYQHSIGSAIAQGQYYSLWGNSIKNIEGVYGSGIGTYFRFLRFLLGLNVFTSVLSLCFVVLPQILDRLYEDGKLVPNAYNQSASFGDFFTGDGWLQETELFHGFYTSKEVNAVGGSYNMSQAFYYTMFSSYLVTLLIISISMAKSYRRNFIKTQGDEVKSVFLKLVFCTWDFGVSQEKAQNIQRESITNQLKESLEWKNRDKKDDTESGYTVKLMVTVMINIGVLLVLVGIGFLASFIVDELADKPTANFWSLMALSFTLTSIMLVVPIGFNQLSRLETTIPTRKKVYLNLTRTVFLEAVILGMVIVKYLNHTNSKFGLCWETRTGQEMYRFLLVYFFILVIFTFIVDMLHIFISSKAEQKWIGQPTFDIARNTMNLIYVQTIVWLGFYFSPLLPLILVIILFLTFYAKKATLDLNPNLTRKPWRAAQSKTIFHVFAFFSCIGASLIMAYVVVSVHPSSACGPFKHLSESYPYEIMADSKFFADFFLFQPAVITGIIVGLSVAIFYIRTLGVARRKTVRVLREKIRTEGLDRSFLIKLMRTMSNLKTEEKSNGAKTMPQVPN